MFLQITDGTISVTLSGSGTVTGCTYFPTSAQLSDKSLVPVAETAEVVLKGTQANIRSVINDLEILLQRALERSKSNVGDRVYVNYKPVDGDATTYRSEVFEGRVVTPENPGLRRLGDTAPTMVIGVVWLRAPGWDGAEVELALSATSQASSTGGRTIANNPATGNWVQIDGATIGGVLPSPMRLQLANSTGATQPYRKFMIGINAKGDPSSFVHSYQGEARISGGSVVADGTASGSNVLEITLGSSPTAYLWALAAADIQQAGGRRFRVWMRTAGATGSLFVRPQIRNTGSAVLWSGDEIALNAPVYATWRDLGVVPLPPGGGGVLANDLRLALVVRGTGVVQIDILQLTALDSYAYLELPPAGITVANTNSVVYDGIERQVYVLAGTLRTPLPTAYGGGLFLQPRRTQRIHTMYQIDPASGTDYAPVGGTLSVRVYYRPRRLTV